MRASVVTTPRGAAPGRRLGNARLHRSGTDAQRVLLVGDRSFLDDRSTMHGIRLAEQIADRVGALTGRGLDLDVVWDLAPALQAVAAATQAWRLWRYEAVVVLVRSTQLQDGSGWRSGRITRVAQRVIPELAEASRVLVVRLEQASDPLRSHREYGRGVVSSITVPIDADGGVEELPQRAGEIADRLADLLHAA